MKKLFIVRRVVGKSMLPALQEGRLIVAVRMHPMRGDVVVFEHGGIEKIKRISRMNKRHVELLGDNPEASIDSRHFGILPIDCIMGKVVWPRGLHRYR